MMRLSCFASELKDMRKESKVFRLQMIMMMVIPCDKHKFEENDCCVSQVKFESRVSRRIQCDSRCSCINS